MRTPENIIDNNKYTSVDMKKELRNKLDTVEKKLTKLKKLIIYNSRVISIVIL